MLPQSERHRSNTKAKSHNVTVCLATAWHNREELLGYYARLKKDGFKAYGRTSGKPVNVSGERAREISSLLNSQAAFRAVLS
jgi:hypothetical protein